MSIILTCNAGSTNTKLAAFDSKTLQSKAHTVSHNAAETVEWVCSIGEMGIDAIGHRVVHGGKFFTEATTIDDDTLKQLKRLSSLAPLHQPPAIKLIEEVKKLYPYAPQVACFDTAFHHTVSPLEKRFPLPREFHEEGIQRYGFHGLSYQHIASELPKIVKEKAHGRVIVAHLGGGSSACAMKNMQSVATTMGFSTIEGLMMSTRSGSIDAGVVLHMVEEMGMKVSEVHELLYKQSGLLGVSGISGDMKTLLADKSASAREAVELYCHSAAKQIAGLIPALGGLDVLVFTGGIGENAAPVREKISGLLKWIGDFLVYVIPTDEEIVIAESCRDILREE